MMKYIVIHCNVYRDIQFVTYIGRGAERFSDQEKKIKSVSVRILIRPFNIFLDYDLCKYKHRCEEMETDYSSIRCHTANELPRNDILIQIQKMDSLIRGRITEKRYFDSNYSHPG